MIPVRISDAERRFCIAEARRATAYAARVGITNPHRYNGRDQLTCMILGSLGELIAAKALGLGLEQTKIAEVGSDGGIDLTLPDGRTVDAKVAEHVDPTFRRLHCTLSGSAERKLEERGVCDLWIFSVVAPSWREVGPVAGVCHSWIEGAEFLKRAKPVPLKDPRPGLRSDKMRPIEELDPGPL